jgi:hypothetical protein
MRTKVDGDGADVNHVRLFHLNRRVARVRQNVEKIQRAVVKFHPIAIEFLKRGLICVDDLLRTIVEVAASSKEFARIGFPTSCWAMLVQNNKAKGRLLQESKEELEREIEACEGVYRAVEGAVYSLIK